MRQIGELRVWELDMPFPYIPIPPRRSTTAPRGAKRSSENKKADRAAKETPEDPEAKIIELKDLVNHCTKDQLRWVQPEENASTC